MCLFEISRGAHDDEDRVCDRDVRSVSICVRGTRVGVCYGLKLDARSMLRGSCCDVMCLCLSTNPCFV